MKEIPSSIYGESPGMIFTDQDGARQLVQTINLDPDTQEIIGLTDFADNPLDIDDITYNKYVLFVPGIGNILPGSRVIWKEKDYVLQFGWHTNISNQTIYTWYLEPLEGIDLTPKTLYQWMIKEIEIVHFRR